MRKEKCVYVLAENWCRLLRRKLINLDEKCNCFSPYLHFSSVPTDTCVFKLVPMPGMVHVPVVSHCGSRDRKIAWAQGIGGQLWQAPPSEKSKGLLSEQPERPVAGTASWSPCVVRPAAIRRCPDAHCPWACIVPARVFKKTLVLLSEIIEK